MTAAPVLRIAGPTLALVLAARRGAAVDVVRRLFRPEEIVELPRSPDDAAWDGALAGIAQRLSRGDVAAVPAAGLDTFRRRQLTAAARAVYAARIAVVLDYPEEAWGGSAGLAPGDGRAALVEAIAGLRADIPRLSHRREGFRGVIVVPHPAAADSAKVIRRPLACDRQWDHGPFDLIGDIHGCISELRLLLAALGYQAPASGGEGLAHPAGRRAVFLGDLVDRGPGVTGALRLAMAMVKERQALWVPGNHDLRLLRVLQGGTTAPTHGLDQTLAQMDREPPDFRQQAASFLGRWTSHYVLAGGALVAVHGGLNENMHGRDTGAVLAFALYGDTTGAVDETGYPVRRDWAAGYAGTARVVYGHTPVLRPQWVNNTINIDTGCVFGGALTALRYPELEIVQVPAARAYCAPGKPFGGE